MRTLHLLSILLVAVWARGASAQLTNFPSTLGELQQRLGAHVNQARFRAALWGVKIESLDTGVTLFEHNPGKLFSPASNCKLYTVALALDRFGADYRIETLVSSSAPPDKRGRLRGDLIISGRGDPGINGRLHEGDLNRALAPFVAIVTNAGIKRISGDIIGDATWFRGPEFGAGWDWEDLQYYYGAEISALTINDNVLQASIKPAEKVGQPCRVIVSPVSDFLLISNRTTTVAAGQPRKVNLFRPLDQNLIYVTGQVPLGHTGLTEEVTFHDPAGFFARCLRDALQKAGVKTSGQARSRNWTPGEAGAREAAPWKLGSVASLPLAAVAREIQKPSQNLYTDLLLAHVGETARTPEDEPDMPSGALGIRELNRFLKRTGCRDGAVFFEEGSGLSRNNLATPEATVALLRYMGAHGCARVFEEALPVAGVDGTLRRRMRNTPAGGNVRAKTGTLRWANSLSGYVTSAAGERLVFSIMLNRYNNADPSTPTREDVDAIAVLLAGFTGKSQP